MKLRKFNDDRVFKNDKQYLVKWKDYNSSHNSWESESNFVSMQPIQNYWQSKKSGKSIRSRRIEKVNIATATRLSPTQLQLTLLQIFTVLLVLQPFQAIRIHDSFTYCEGLSNAKRLDMKSTCTQEKPNLDFQQILLKSKDNDMAILRKVTHLISGTAYQCKMEKVIMKTYNTFFNEQTTSIKTEHIRLTVEDCKHMLQTKRCKDEIMQCEGFRCSSKAVLEEKFQWLKQIEQVGYNCYLEPRVISSQSPNDNLFGVQSPPCRALSFFCQLPDSIIIWSRDVIHTCPYEIIGRSSFDLLEQNILVSRNDSLLFQIHDHESTCNGMVYSTTEGLYLVEAINMKSFRVGKLDLRSVQDLTLADLDYRSLKEIQATKKV